MNGSAVEPKNHHRRLYLVFATATILIVVLVIAFFAFQYLAFQDTRARSDPLLYNNAVTVQAVANQSSYWQEHENASISVYVINGKDEPYTLPPTANTVSYKVLDSTGQEVDSVHVMMNFASPLPTFPAHSKNAFGSYVWNLKDSNLTAVKSGNYTIKVSLELGTSECEIVVYEGDT